LSVALRALRSNPAFALVAVLTSAVAIAGNSAQRLATFRNRMEQLELAPREARTFVQV
jgi:hypothetical protein